ncbi:MAG: 5'-3' exonuclease H3TH domain-containing protein [Myxococcota bacterium]
MSDGPALILDGYSLLFRSFYALPPMSTRAGVPTGALYGVSVLLLKLLREERPAALAFALDAPGPTVRHEAFGAYKAGRAPAPDPLREQLVRLPELAAAFGAPVHRVPGWEADDVVASLCCAVPGPTLVVSGDTDLVQLVDADTTLLFVGRRQKEHVRYDVDAVRARYGFDPRGIPTYKALAGDPSDNLPGIPGIGAKTAAQLVLEHGDAAGIVAAHATLPARARRALADHLEALPRWEQLATLNRELPLAPPLTGPADGYDALRTWFAANEFKSLLARVEALAAGTTAPPRAGGRSRRA